MVYIYEFLLIYSPPPVVSGQPDSQSIQCVAKVFQQASLALHTHIHIELLSLQMTLIAGYLDGTVNIIIGCKGMDQGHPLIIVIYELVVLPLIKDLQELFPYVHQN